LAVSETAHRVLELLSIVSVFDLIKV